MKNKNLIILTISILILILVFALLIRSNSSLEVVGDNFKIDDSISEVKNEDILNKDFFFGEFVNDYKEDNFEFSLMYPEELGVAQVQKSCDISLYLKKPSYPSFLLIRNPDCDSAFKNPNATSLDDYKKDYVPKSGGIIHIIDSEKIITNYGTIGIKQKYHKFQNEEEIKNTNIDNIIPSTRYVFYNNLHGFYILYVAPPFSDNYFQKSEKVDVYLDLEEKIVNTIKY